MSGHEWAGSRQGVGKQQVGWVACEACMQARQSKRSQPMANAAAVAKLSAAAAPTAPAVQRATVQARVLGTLQHMQQHSP